MKATALPVPKKERNSICLFFLMIVLIVFSPANLLAQGYLDKISSHELREKVIKGGDKERIIIVMLEADNTIRDLQLRSDNTSPFKNTSYHERSSMALNHGAIQEMHKELLRYAEPHYTSFYQHAEGVKSTIDNHYYLFMNAFVLSAKYKDIKKIAALDFVTSIIDGEEEREFRVPERPYEETGHFNRDEELSWESLVASNSGYTAELEMLHDLGYKGHGGRIGIVDTGIEYDHPLVNKVFDGESIDFSKMNVAAVGWPGNIFFWGANDTHGHGTEVAGVAWQVVPMSNFYIVRFPAGLYLNVQLSNAIEWLKGWDVDAVNFSFGGITNSCLDNPSNRCEIIGSLYDDYIIPTVAAGNSEIDDFPISNSYDHRTISVYGTRAGNDGHHNVFSHRASPVNPCPDMLNPRMGAPGREIETLTLVEYGSIIRQTGSSYAAPFVAGVSVLLKQVANSIHGKSPVGAVLARNSIFETLHPVFDFYDEWENYQPGRINPYEAYLHLVGEPELSLTPTSYDFGNITVGATSNEATFVLTNIGGGIAEGGVYDLFSEFSIIQGGGSFSLSASQEKEITVVFEPSNEGGFTGFIDAVTDDEIVYSELLGTGVLPEAGDPELTITPTSYDFGDVTVGTTSSEVTLVLTNIGGGIAEGEVFNYTSEFVITQGGGSFSLGSNQEREITVVFEPSNEGGFADFIDAQTDAETVYSELLGTGVLPDQPELVITPGSYDFYEVATNEASNEMIFQITNIGNSPAVGEYGLNIGEHFHISTQEKGNYYLDPGESMSIGVIFEPSEVGTFNDFLIIEADDSFAVAELQGTGVVPIPLRSWAIYLTLFILFVSIIYRSFASIKE